MRKLFLPALSLCLMLIPILAWAEPKTNEADANAVSDMMVIGKLYYPVTHPVLAPYDGVLTALSVRPGTRVKKGDVLARYRLTPESAIKLSRRLFPAEILKLDADRIELTQKRYALEEKKMEIEGLAKQNLAPAQALERVRRELDLLDQQQVLLDKKLDQAQKMQAAELALIKERMGIQVQAGAMPTQAAMLAPVDGHVVWFEPDLEVGGLLKAERVYIQVAVTDPIILRAMVHEIEIVQLHVGDEIEFTLESIPNRTFKAKVGRISWTPNKLEPRDPSYYQVDFTVPNPKLLFREGLRARITFKGLR